MAGILEWNPPVHGEGTLTLSGLPVEHKLVWLDRHREELVRQVRLAAGHSFANALRRITGRESVSYRGLLCDVAKLLQIADYSGTEADLEARIVSSLLSRLIEKLTPEERQNLLRHARAEAQKLGLQVEDLSEAIAVGRGLPQSDVAGFGLYVAAASVLGALNGALGLDLGLGSSMALSEITEAAAGPARWGLFIVSLLFAIGGPNYRKLLPVVLLVAAYRRDLAVQLSEALERDEPAAWVGVLSSMPVDPEHIQNWIYYVEKTALAGRDQWPRNPGWNAVLAFAWFLNKREEGVHGVITFFRAEMEKNAGAAIFMAELWHNLVARVAPQVKDWFLEALLAADPGYAQFCYLRSTDFSEAHLQAIAQIADGLLETLHSIGDASVRRPAEATSVGG